MRKLQYILNRTYKKKPGLLSQAEIRPVSRKFGFDRGLPIDRYYVQKFLIENRGLIKGTVLEIAGREYTQKYGGGNVEKSYILHVAEAKDEFSIKGNLETGEGIPSDLVDCFILTQTLPFIYDIESVAKNVIKVLKPGGHALITVGGITQISRYDMDRWGHFWSFTDLSLRKLFSGYIPENCIKVNTFGNVKTATCFLYGLASNEIPEEDFSFIDKDYQVLITAVVQKPK